MECAAPKRESKKEKSDCGYADEIPISCCFLQTRIKRKRKKEKY
jgi:hypothetical protein